MFDHTVVVRGGGDLGSGVAVRLSRSGFPVVVLEVERPLAVRRTVSLSEAVYDGRAQVEEVVARRAIDLAEVERTLACGEIPVHVDPAGRSIAVLGPYAVVDAILAKRNLGTRMDMAPCVVGLGPGFTAGCNVHAVVETNRGPNLGRVLWSGGAEANTGDPALVLGRAASRVLRAPADGTLHARHAIGNIVEEGETVAEVDGRPIVAQFRGLLRGLARDGLAVSAGMKVGDVDPRLQPDLCRLVSDKSLAVAGGVLEAVLKSMRQ